MRFSPRRELGRTGFVATMLGAGDLADRSLGVDACASTLRRALDAGLNLVDTAPAYEEGFSEQVVGRALAGRRAGVFVIDKVDHLDQPVGPQVEGSIARLGFEPDAFVFHSVSRAALDELRERAAAAVRGKSACWWNPTPRERTSAKVASPMQGSGLRRA